MWSPDLRAIIIAIATIIVIALKKWNSALCDAVHQRHRNWSGKMKGFWLGPKIGDGPQVDDGWLVVDGAVKV